MFPQKSFKIRIFSLAENEFQTTKFPDFQRSLSNSLTFPGFPGQSHCFCHIVSVHRIVSVTALQIWCEKMSKKPCSIQLLG